MFVVAIVVVVVVGTAGDSAGAVATATVDVVEIVALVVAVVAVDDFPFAGKPSTIDYRHRTRHVNNDDNTNKTLKQRRYWQTCTAPASSSGLTGVSLASENEYISSPREIVRQSTKANASKKKKKRTPNTYTHICTTHNLTGSRIRRDFSGARTRCGRRL